MEYYSAIKKNTLESVLMRWMKLEPIVQSEVKKRLAAGGCLQACTGKDRVSFHTGGAPALRPGAIAQSSLPKPCPASSVRAREGAGCGSVGAVSGA